MIIVYTRGSTAKQALTIGAQRSKAEVYARLNDIAIDLMIDDSAVTSKKSLGKRPGGRRLEQFIANGGVTGVIVTRLDRAFRSTAECLETVERWQKLGVGLHCIDFGGTPLNTQSSTGKLILTFFAAIAEWERMIISERTTEAMQHKKANGKLTTRPDRVEYGYRVDWYKNVIQDESEQAIIKEMVVWRSEGMGPKAIAASLMKLGIKIRGKARWHANTVARILQRATEDGL